MLWSRISIYREKVSTHMIQFSIAFRWKSFDNAVWSCVYGFNFLRLYHIPWSHDVGKKNLIWDHQVANQKLLIVCSLYCSNWRASWQFVDYFKIGHRSWSIIFFIIWHFNYMFVISDLTYMISRNAVYPRPECVPRLRTRDDPSD